MSIMLSNASQHICTSNAVMNFGGSYNYYILLYANIVETSLETGKHKVRVLMTLASDNQYASFNGYNTTASATVNGVNVFSWASQPVPNGTWQTVQFTEERTYKSWINLQEGYVYVDVGFGSAKEVTISASFQRNDLSNPPSYVPRTDTFYASATVTLPAIAGAAVPTLSASKVEMGTPVTIYTNRKSADFTCQVDYKFGDIHGPIFKDKRDSYKWETDLALAAQIPYGTSGNGKILCTTFDANGNQVGETQSVPITLTVPNDSRTQPSVSMTLSPVDSPFDGLYVQGLTKVDANLSATAKYGAFIYSSDYFQMVIGNSAYGYPFTSGLLTQTGNVTVTGKATDSRGIVGSTQETITVIPYAKPAVIPASNETNIVCARCDEDGNFADNGTSLRIIAKRKYSPVVSNGVQNNFCEIRYQVNNSEDWRTILAAENTDSDEVDFVAVNAVPDTTTSYTVDIGVVDYVGKAEYVTIIVPTARVDFHLRNGGKGAAFGEYAENENEFSVAEDWTVNIKGSLKVMGKGLFDAIYPVGSIYMSVNSADPGTLFGGTWERLKDRFLLGAGDTYANGATGGEAKHTLTSNEIPSHQHSYNNLYNGYPLAEYRTGSGQYYAPLYDNKTGNESSNAYANTATTKTGGGAAHNNMPPYLAVYIWKRTA